MLSCSCYILLLIDVLCSAVLQLGAVGSQKEVGLVTALCLGRVFCTFPSPHHVYAGPS
jgi:hypothetical protein